MGERLLEQGGVFETIADALLEAGNAAAATARLLRASLLRGSVLRNSILRRGPLRGAFVGGRRQGGRWSGGRTDRLAAGGATRCFGGSCLACSPAAHRTIVNSRLQRTDQGQRHTIQADSPSRIEKK